MNHLQHSAFVFFLHVASYEKFSSFISEMGLNLIKSEVSELLLPNKNNATVLDNSCSLFR